MQHGMDALSASLNADVRAVRQELEERASELEEASKSGSNTVEQDVRALEYRSRPRRRWGPEAAKQVRSVRAMLCTLRRS